jgi:hypothetical protein
LSAPTMNALSKVFRYSHRRAWYCTARATFQNQDMDEVQCD